MSANAKHKGVGWGPGNKILTEDPPGVFVRKDLLDAVLQLNTKYNRVFIWVIFTFLLIKIVSQYNMQVIGPLNILDT